MFDIERILSLNGLGCADTRLTNGRSSIAMGSVVETSSARSIPQTSEASEGGLGNRRRLALGGITSGFVSLFAASIARGFDF